VTVFGAQFYDNNRCIEPLPALLQRCKKLILVDIDAVTLYRLRAILDSPKVTTVETDLTRLVATLTLFQSKVRQQATTHADFIKWNTVFYQHAAQEIEKQSTVAPLAKEIEKSDYVISSLVASELVPKIQSIIFQMFEKHFGIPAGDFSHKKSMIIFEQLPIDLQQDLNIAKKKCEYLLTKRHVQHLVNCTTEQGKIYFADEIAAAGISTYKETDLQNIRNILVKAKQGNKPLEKTWHWADQIEYKQDAFIPRTITALLA
jgi:hypothetical protein